MITTPLKQVLMKGENLPSLKTSAILAGAEAIG